MINPFLEFKNIPVAAKDIPLESLVKQNRRMLNELMAGYQCLDQNHVKEFCRLMAHCLNFNVYKTLLSSMELPKFLASTLNIAATLYESSLQECHKASYIPKDLEEFCALVGLTKEADFEQTAPMGLYISALINASKVRTFELVLHRHQRDLHFLGFRLPKGKHLSIKGDLGHFSGADLRGGHLQLTGSTGSWCGANMISGHIKIMGDAHSKTGDQMKGGQIQVAGKILEIAKHRSGGDIHNGLSLKAQASI